MKEDECIGCPEEVDLFGAEIGGKYVCGDCAEPYLMKWYGKHGRVEMDKETANRVIKELIAKKRK